MAALQPPHNGGDTVASDQVGSKRHRRPSVRLGDIGGDHSSGDHHHHQQQQQRRTKSQWKDPFNKPSKSRNVSSNGTLTLVDTTNLDDNGNFRNNAEDDEDRDVNLDSVAIGSWKIRDSKSKKGSTIKRVRSNWASKSNDNEGGEDLEGNDQINRDFEPESSAHSPVHSYENNNSNHDIDRGIGNLNGSRRRETRVSEEGPSDTEVRGWNCSSDRNVVRVWLNQLGLGRYAPVFEIHEVDDEVLPMLTLEDLKDMGINAVGSRRKMYCSIQKLNKGFS